ncbi:hypothetical protein [Actinocatenispora comari]|uniref:DUF2637 domain-containing protein n=1 Tax=Actinocatenispora comari TaxID=2807577 RepID=A0A8J4EMV5_9ACTN|nr:hypothetical protein [Actinocatenispora comari]GIL27069.1 hypothetical protein NUM_23230 [Actinocatenispora comari]
MAEASKTQRVEDVARLGIMAAIGVMAGAASFTHMHDWTMQALPHGTADWFGWANAVASELMPTCALLEIRRKRRAGGSITYPVLLLVASGLLSLGAQVSQAGDTLTSKGLAALPAVAFMLLVKLVFSGLPKTSGTTEPVAPQQEQATVPAPAKVEPPAAPAAPVPAAPAVTRPVPTVPAAPVAPSGPVVPGRANGRPVVIGR